MRNDKDLPASSSHKPISNRVNDVPQMVPLAGTRSQSRRLWTFCAVVFDKDPGNYAVVLLHVPSIYVYFNRSDHRRRPAPGDRLRSDWDRISFESGGRAGRRVARRGLSVSIRIDWSHRDVHDGYHLAYRRDQEPQVVHRPSVIAHQHVGQDAASLFGPLKPQSAGASSGWALAVFSPAFITMATDNPYQQDDHDHGCKSLKSEAMATQVPHHIGTA